MKYLFIVLSFCSFAVCGQTISQSFGTISGTPLKVIKYENVNGHPYLLDYWAKGNVTTKSGKKLSDIKLKYDIMDDKPIFEGEDGSPMYFVEPIAAFEIARADASDYKFISGLPVTDGLNPSSFFQVIASGKISLFKRVYKNITETKEYGSATVDKSFNEYTSYYVLQNEKLSKITLNKKAFITLIPDKEKQITDYLKKEKTDIKQDSELSKLFIFLSEL